MMNEYDHLCMAKSKSQWNFVRSFYCSLAIGHKSPHRSYWSHDLDGEVAWLGPWEDNSYFIVGADLGLKEWNETN